MPLSGLDTCQREGARLDGQVVRYYNPYVPAVYRHFERTLQWF